MKTTLPETLLHRIWKEPLRYLSRELCLIDGSPIQLLSSGEHNQHSDGPDFLNAEIVIDGIVVIGDIEIHRSYDDWHAHHHSGDQHYSRVILHVVFDYDEDADIKPPNIPTLVLKENLDFHHREFWSNLFKEYYARSPELPCFPHNLSVPMKFKRKLLARSSEARLDQLIARYDAETILQFYETIYMNVLDALGYSANRKPMRSLAHIIPRELLIAIRKDEDETKRRTLFEALYLGASGLLTRPSKDFSSEVNEYLIELTSQWEGLQASYPITDVLAKSDWTFFGVRPGNSPYRRVALAASLADKYFSREDYSVHEDITFDEMNTFWSNRSSYTRYTDREYSLLGSERSRAILLNVLLPARIAFSTYRTKKNTEEQRREWRSLRSNAKAAYMNIIEQELLEGNKLRTVGDEQGALLLYRTHCKPKRCAECPIGVRLMEKGMMSRA